MSRLLVHGLVVPFTVAAVAASGWYIATGQTPLDVLRSMARTPRIEMLMPPRPGPEKPTASLIHPPAGAPPSASEAKAGPPAESAGSAEAPPKGASPTAPTTPPATPAVSSAATPGSATTPPPAPAIAEPTVPAAGDSLAPPSFAQLPARQDLKPLPEGPIAELLRNGPTGALPITAGGKEPWRAYARPFSGDKNLPRVAVVVTGLGLSKDATNAAISKLPPDVSLSFSPYAANLDAWIKRARASGHEVLMDLPLEPRDFPVRDAGPMAVLAQSSPAEAIEHLEAVLAKATSYVGVAGALRSPVAGTDPWRPIMRDLKERGLLFVGDGIAGMAESDLPPAANVSLVADDPPFRAAIDARLTRLLLAAQRDGTALAYVSAQPVSFERLMAWIDSLPQKGVVLGPASAVVRPQP